MSVSEPQKFQHGCCTKCGTPRSVLNPKWLRAKRERAGLSLRDVAPKVGFSIVYLSDIERGNRACPVKVREVYETL
jgi:predicted transcriptional regulator